MYWDYFPFILVMVNPGMFLPRQCRIRDRRISIEVPILHLLKEQGGTMVTFPFGQPGEIPEKSTPAMHPIIDLQSVSKSYKTEVGDYPALKGIDLRIHAGEFVGIIGKSGSGKSTLLNMITGIDRPSAGEVYVNNTAVHRLSQNQIAR
jgi:ABC-type bacteriocin/lantibiotic exporter with double-glycine peptidase domain